MHYDPRAMDKPFLHHILVAVDDLERSRTFYRDVLEMEEIARPPFNFPGLWFRIGTGDQHLHIIVGMAALQRTGRPNNPQDIHFALRVKSYKETLIWLKGKGFREDLPTSDLKNIQLRPNSITGHPQIYIMDPDRNIIEFNCEHLE
jgi:glyoxylase I family protein